MMNICTTGNLQYRYYCVCNTDIQITCIQWCDYISCNNIVIDKVLYMKSNQNTGKQSEIIVNYHDNN